MEPFGNIQRLRQVGERDCGVSVFAELAGVSWTEVLQDLPESANGKVGVEKWRDWLNSKGLDLVQNDGCDEYTLPCAHLVGNDPTSKEDFHWVYRDESGVHDPSSVFAAMPSDHPWMLGLCSYNQKVLTISVKRMR